jgi:hypothetical protein
LGEGCDAPCPCEPLCCEAEPPSRPEPRPLWEPPRGREERRLMRLGLGLSADAGTGTGGGPLDAFLGFRAGASLEAGLGGGGAVLPPPPLPPSSRSRRVSCVPPLGICPRGGACFASSVGRWRLFATAPGFLARTSYSSSEPELVPESSSSITSGSGTLRFDIVVVKLCATPTSTCWLLSSVSKAPHSCRQPVVKQALMI